jgi:hypothetical protein
MSDARRKVVVVAIGCALVAAVALALTFFRESDEERINKLLVHFAKTVSVKPADTLISRTARIRSELGEIVDDGVRVTVPELGVRSNGRRQFEEDAIRAGSMFTEADCDFANVTIKLGEGATFATVDATAIVSGLRGGERKVDRRDVHFLLRKEKGWKLTSIDLLSQTVE